MKPFERGSRFSVPFDIKEDELNFHSISNHLIGMMSLPFMALFNVPKTW